MLTSASRIVSKLQRPDELPFWARIPYLGIFFLSGGLLDQLIVSFVGMSLSTGGWIFLLLLLGLMGGLVCRGAYLAVLAETFKPKNTPLNLKTGPRKGLVYLVSSNELALKALRKCVIHHRAALECLWLFQSDASEPQAKAFADELSGEPNPPSITRHKISNPMEIQGSYQEILAAMNDFLPAAWEKQDVICDITGMTGPVSVALTLAAIKLNLDVEYMLQSNVGGQNPAPFHPVVLELPI